MSVSAQMNYLKQPFASGMDLLLMSLTSFIKSPVTNVNSTPARIGKVKYDDTTREINYLRDGSIHTMRTRESDGTFTGNLEFSYKNGKVASVNMGSTKLVYTYNHTLLSKIELVNAADMLLYTYEFAYDSAGRLFSQTEYIKTSIPGQMKPLGQRMYRYNNRGNISTMSIMEYTDGAWKKAKEILYVSYDNQPNTGSLLESYPFLPLTTLYKNNPLVEEHRNEWGQVVERIIHDYTYDSNGRVITRKTTEISEGCSVRASHTAFCY